MTSSTLGPNFGLGSNRLVLEELAHFCEADGPVPLFVGVAVVPLLLLTVTRRVRTRLDGRTQVVDHCAAGVEVRERDQLDEDADTVGLGERVGVVPVQDELAEEEQQAVALDAVGRPLEHGDDVFGVVEHADLLVVPAVDDGHGPEAEALHLSLGRQ